DVEIAIAMEEGIGHASMMPLSAQRCRGKDRYQSGGLVVAEDPAEMAVERGGGRVGRPHALDSSRLGRFEKKRSGLRGGRHDGAGLAKRRGGLLNQRSTLACIPRLLRLRDQVPRL